MVPLLVWTSELKRIAGEYYLVTNTMLTIATTRTMRGFLFKGTIFLWMTATLWEICCQSIFGSKFCWLNYETSGTSDENGLAYGGEVWIYKIFWRELGCRFRSKVSLLYDRRGGSYRHCFDGTTLLLLMLREWRKRIGV